MSTTNLRTAAGSVKGYFGTTKSRGLGGVIQSHNHTLEAEEATAADENGDICFIMKYNHSAKGTIELLMLNDADSKAAREQLVVGGTFTIPTNKALRTVAGLPIIDSVEETTSNGELAKFTITYTARPNVTEVISGDILTSSEE
jgi:hypothetical protein